MKKPVFVGSAVAIVTPFSDNGVDFDKFAELCEFHISSKTQAIIVAGTTGEASTMPDDEHLQTISHAVKTVDGRIPIIAGTGSNDTKHAVELAMQAAGLGADALLVVTPYYNKASQEGLYRHYKAIHDSVDIPIIVYNVPSRTCLNVSPETLARLSELPRINGVKECNIGQAAEVAWRCGNNLNMYTGEDGMIMPMLSFGGKGVISVVANVVPSMTQELTEAWFSGDREKAVSIQIKLVPLIKAMFCEVNPIPVKAALNMMGFKVGECRMPLCEPAPKSQDLIRRTLSDMNLI